METFETARLDRYFRAVTDVLGVAGTNARSLLITHMLADRPAFVRAVDRVAAVAAVLPKPKSVYGDAIRTVGLAYPVDALTREQFTDPDTAVAYLEQRAAGWPLVLLDVGGYFAPVLPELYDRFSGRILGVVEDTENGHRRYAELGKPPCPVYSVARSPLKQPEDHLVGQSIVFSTEALMRSRGAILPGRAATVIGFGKLGSSIARTLHAKGVRVTVYDADPVRATQALAHGFHVAPTRSAALATAGMVMCATGNLALRHHDFTALANGAYLASVTSSEDELELDALAGVYEQTPVAEHVTRYATVGHFFYVLAGGNAVNFLHGASVGAFIFLVQAEILAAAARCASRDIEPGYHEVPDADRRRIAETLAGPLQPPGGTPMIAAEAIRATVTAYLHRHPDEAGRLAPLTAALDQPAGELTSRTTFTGHVTCSAIVLDPAGRVLHIRHNALGTWLRPGGHLDPGDTTLTGAALREVAEETGIDADALALVDEVPTDIDVHPIPANPAKGAPDHQHFDLRYAFTAATAPDVALQAEEVHDFAWRPAAEIEPPWLGERITAVTTPA